MARRKIASIRPFKDTPGLSRALLVTVVVETYLSILAFVHFGAGTSNIAVDRFPPWGAELLMVITALTAGCAWFALYQQRWAVYGMFSGMGAGILWIWAVPPKQDDLPGLVSWFVVVTLVLAAADGFFLTRYWHRFKRT